MMMKNKHVFLSRKVSICSILAVASLFSSCTIGDDDDWLFNPGVSGVTLQSPDVSQITFTLNAEGNRVTVEWPVVYGAGGYEFEFYNVDDPANLDTIVPPTTVDGSSFQCAVEEDCKYQAWIRTMGNAQYNNTEAGEASVKEFSTMLAVFKEIPSGSDIAQYFQENPIPADSTNELSYNLVAGGDYTMSEAVDFGGHKITIRGDKTNHPTVTLGKNATFTTFGGLKIKFIDFECKAQTSGGFVTLHSKPNDSIKVGSGEYFIKDVIALQNCTLNDVNKSLFYDNKVKYAVNNLSVSDCVIKFNQSDIIFFFGKGMAVNTNVKNSTFYSTTASNKQFVQYKGNRPNKITGVSSGGFTIANCTFYKISEKANFADWSGMQGQTCFTMTLQKNIFVNCGKKDMLTNKFFGREATPHVCEDNTYFFDGVMCNESYDTSLSTDPGFANPGNGVFTVSGQEQLTKATGAPPRWLPEGAGPSEVWGIERSVFFNGREKWAKGFENQRV